MGYRFFPLPDPFPDRNFPLQAIEVQRGIKKFIKKQVKNLEKEESLPYLCTRFRERGHEGKRLNEGTGKKFEKKA